MVPSYLDSYPRDCFLNKARSNGLSIQTAARKEKQTFTTLICWTISYLEIKTKEDKGNPEVMLGEKIFKSQLKMLDELSHWGKRFHLTLGMTDICFYICKKRC